VERLEESAVPEKMLKGKLFYGRRRGPRTRWLDDVMGDLAVMGINGWREMTRKSKSGDCRGGQGCSAEKEKEELQMISMT
jgi:hypothetical protein